MTGVMPSLKTHYRLGAVGEQINNLALTFIAPLGAQHYHIPAHLPFSTK
jgi:hypothetical protein